MPAPKRPYYLPATKLAQMGDCELRLVLESRLGDMTTKAQREARKVGVRAHADFHERTMRHHNRREGASARDSRCFIASQVFGLVDPRTERLRRYRDERLLTTAAGRVLVWIYYRISPWVAGRLVGRPRAGRVVGRGLEWFIAWMEGEGK